MLMDLAEDLIQAGSRSSPNPKSKYVTVFKKSITWFGSGFAGLGFNAYDLMLKIQCFISGLWSLVSGFWSLVSGLWSLVSGFWQLYLEQPAAFPGENSGTHDRN